MCPQWRSTSPSLINGLLLHTLLPDQGRNLGVSLDLSLFPHPRPISYLLNIFWAILRCLAYSKRLINAGCYYQTLQGLDCPCCLVFHHKPPTHWTHLIFWPFFYFGSLNTILFPLLWVLCTTLSLIKFFYNLAQVSHPQEAFQFPPPTPKLTSQHALWISMQPLSYCSLIIGLLICSPPPINLAFPDQVINSSGVEYSISNWAPSLPPPLPFLCSLPQWWATLN